VTRRAGADADLPTTERRLTLTPLGLDVIAALAHDHRGIRLTPLATILGAPVSSTQAALRILMRHRLVTSVREDVPVYQLGRHPARDSLVDVAITTNEASQTIATVVRSSAAVAVALVDEQGFVVGVDPSADDGDRERLLRSLVRIREAHPDAPPVQTNGLDDLSRLAGVSVGSRARLLAAVALKGSLALITGGRPGVRDGVRPALR
jgi:IclR-like helix-turn-helix domain-containing protein